MEDSNPTPRCEESALFDHEYRRGLLGWAAERVRPSFSALAWQAFWQTGVEGKSPRSSPRTSGCPWAQSINTRAGVVARNPSRDRAGERLRQYL